MSPVYTGAEFTPPPNLFFSPDFFYLPSNLRQKPPFGGGAAPGASVITGSAP
jgi:hypothetical protein